MSSKLAFTVRFNTLVAMKLNGFKLLIGVACFFSTFQAKAQDRALGTWRMYFPLSISKGVCDGGDVVYSAAEKSIFSYNKTTGEIQQYDKANGLSDIGIKSISYDAATKFLVVAYTNTNLDLIYNGTDVYNLPDIKNYAINGAVGINNISFYNGDAYVASDLGVSIINLNKKEVSNTYIIGAGGNQVPVYAAAADGNNIYAATQQGLKYASMSSSNLADFNSWQLFDTTQIPHKKATWVAAYNGKVYAVIPGANSSDTLYEYNGTAWTKIFYNTKNTVTSLSVVNNTLYFSVFDDSTGRGKLGKITPSGLQLRLSEGHNRPMSWFESNGISWEGDFYNGLFKNNLQGNIENIVPDGPYNFSAFRLNIKNGVVNVAAGGVDESWAFTYNRSGFYIYENGKWKNYNQYTNGALTDMSDILCTASVPVLGKTYFGSFFAGLAELSSDGSIKVYNKDNSDGFLEKALGDELRTKISAMTSDEYNNVWIGNAGATKPIKIIKSDGTRKQFGVPYSFELMKRMIVDRNQQLWAPLRPQGILVWNYGADMEDVSDDVSRILNTGEGLGGLPNANVSSIAEDKDGDIWVGTDAGIAVYYCPGSVLTTNGCDAQQIKVTRDGYVGYLFGMESVRAIAVDAANRKWIGTTNGVWLVSADGQQQLLNFNMDNSPLPTNQVIDIAVDDVTGEVFIATTGGLVSYQGDAMDACNDCKEALVYPNPVKPGYTGPIAIKGLTGDAYVKITDVSGRLIYQGAANGTQMIWDGNNYNGQRAKSGVYLVFSSTDAGKERRVAKILVMN